ncbi:MAG TPA: 1-acyl-sn-glycerol-3-phosphate acyltransferase [Kiritimatiellae bacterium]|nr:1-acyl-sn-glycerol-3-phosphate acyltransferase [Kiritimatiellia bacterium]
MSGQGSAANSSRASNFWYGLGRRLFYVLARLFFRLRVSGVERIPRQGACIVAANHASYLDPPLLGCGVRHRKFHYIARLTLFRNPVLGFLFRRWGVVALDRERGGDVGALRQALRLLKQGHVLALFPEGTRTPDGTIRDAKPGIGFLVAKAGVPVIPAHIDGTFRCLPKGRKVPRLGRVSVSFGAPIVPEEIAACARGADGRSDFGAVSRLVMERIRNLAERRLDQHGPDGWASPCRQV